MEQETTVLNLRKQLLIERIVFAAIVLLLIVFWTVGHFRDAKSLILVNGKPVACVPSASDANDILSQIKSRTGCNPSEITFKQDVRVERAPGTASAVSRHKAYRAVLRVVSPVVPKWAIIVDGVPVVAVPSRDVAGATLEAAKRKYGQLVHNLAEEPQFKQNVTVDVAAVDPAIYRKTADQAVAYLFGDSAPVTEDAIYTVEGGDVAGSIASKCGIKLAELKAMNPSLHLDHLQIGDKLRVKKSYVKPRLTVIVRDMAERTEKIAPPVQTVSSTSLYAGKTYVISQGSAGQRQVQVQTIYENGHKVGSEVVNEQILHDPTPRRVAIGIKNR